MSIQISYHSILKLRGPFPILIPFLVILPIKNEIEKTNLTLAATPPFQMIDMIFEQPLDYPTTMQYVPRSYYARWQSTDNKIVVAGYLGAYDWPRINRGQSFDPRIMWSDIPRHHDITGAMIVNKGQIGHKLMVGRVIHRCVTRALGSHAAVKAVPDWSMLD